MDKLVIKERQVRDLKRERARVTEYYSGQNEQLIQLNYKLAVLLL